MSSYPVSFPEHLWLFDVRKTPTKQNKHVGVFLISKTHKCSRNENASYLLTIFDERIVKNTQSKSSKSCAALRERGKKKQTSFPGSFCPQTVLILIVHPCLSAPVRIPKLIENKKQGTLHGAMQHQHACPENKLLLYWGY